MPRNRMIKPEFWESETLSRLSLESNLLFIGIWNFSDDYGVSILNARRILGEVFPFRENFTEKDVKKWLFELINAELLKVFKFNGKNYIKVTNWSEHQTVANKSKRRCPEFKGNLIVSVDTNLTLISDSLECNDYKEKEKEKEKEKVYIAKKKNNLTQSVADLYNKKCGHILPKVLKINDKRKKLIQKLDKNLVENYGWEQYFDKILESHFLTGDNNIEFTAYFDYLIKESNYLAIIEGKHDNRERNLQF